MAPRRPHRQGDPDGRSASLDTLDRRLIAELQNDPRASFSALGAKLGVTGMTVANRLHRLRSTDLVRLSVEPRLEECGLRTRVLGLIQAEVAALPACTELLRATPNVLRVDNVTGEYDIVFEAAFAHESAMGALVRDLRSLPGVRRLVVYHRLATLKDEPGWDAVFAEPGTTADGTYEVAPTAEVPVPLMPRVTTAASWLQAFMGGDTGALEQLSEPDIVFSIMPPYPGAGTFEGLDAVAAESQRAGEAFRNFWHRVVAVTEAQESNTVVVDAFNTAETRHGKIRSSFARMAFVFRGDRVTRVVRMGQMELPDIEDQAARLAVTPV